MAERPVMLPPVGDGAPGPPMLQIVEKYAGKTAFEPEELRILVAAFEDAWRRLDKSGVRFDTDYHREQVRIRSGSTSLKKRKRGSETSAACGRVRCFCTANLL